MFKKCAVGPEGPNRKIRSRPGGVMRSVAIFGCVAMLATTTLTVRATAMTAAMCKKYGDHCIAGCEQRSIGKDVCINHCVKAQSECLINAPNNTGQNAPTTPDPLNPKGTGGRTPTTGGTKAEPKPPPKVNDTRLPMGGGVFHPKTSGGGSDGPILHSGGSPGPILKSNGGSGPSSRSGERH